ncbi:hypothetical protein K7H20_13960 [Salipiger manganoxidans]|uniref:hypothetical protein n=1 Tax=Salipiger marinus TaxID=555512 RepID=UPI001E5C068C|nr:hypothetical protein [Salipiger manganoxidans]MCD1619171.1 hypothetical protein [Salipiger manganoxidans]
MRQSDLIRCVFTGSALEPDGNFAAAALHDRLGAGEVVLVDLNPQRSTKSHNHQFAFVATAWKNLPEAMKDAPFAASPEHLRKHALISTGYCNADMIALGDEHRAARMADFLRRGDAQQGVYTVIAVRGPTLYRYTAESQREKTMGRQRFQASKAAILEYLADLIGTTPDELAVMSKKEAA